MHKLMCTFATPMKKKILDRNLDTSCPAGIPCKKECKIKVSEFKENMGAIPRATLVLAISTTCIHQVYDDKK